jgi:hypothetical protein
MEGERRIMKNASDQLNDVLKSINSVKRVLRSKKYCYEACESEKIRMIFLVSLQTELILLHTKLDSWIDAGIPMEETE